MRRIFCLVIALLTLSGCSPGRTDPIDGMKLRRNLLESNGCSFDMQICANYGEACYDFSVSCVSDSSGNIHFEVLKPETIQGIKGRIDAGNGQLAFEDVVLALPSLADGELMPVYAPWIFLNTLRNGYMKDQGIVDGLLCMTIMDSFADDALLLRIYLNSSGIPVNCDIFWKGRSSLSIKIENFQIL